MTTNTLAERRLRMLQERLEDLRREFEADGNVDSGEQRRLDQIQRQIDQALEQLASASTSGPSSTTTAPASGTTGPGSGPQTSGGTQTQEPPPSTGPAAPAGGDGGSSPQTGGDPQLLQEAQRIFQRVMPLLQQAANMSGDPSWPRRADEFREHRQAGRHQEALESITALETEVTEFLAQQGSASGTTSGGTQTQEPPPSGGSQPGGDIQELQQAQEIFQRIMPLLQQAASASGDQSWLERRQEYFQHRQAGRGKEALAAIQKLETDVTEFLAQQGSASGTTSAGTQTQEPPPSGPAGGGTTSGGAQSGGDIQELQQAQEIFQRIMPLLQQAASASGDQSWLERRQEYFQHRQAGRGGEALAAIQKLETDVTEFLAQQGSASGTTSAGTQTQEPPPSGPAGGGTTSGGAQSGGDIQELQQAQEIFQRIMPLLQQAASASGDQSWLERRQEYFQHRQAGRGGEALAAIQKLETDVTEFLAQQGSASGTTSAGTQTQEPPSTQQPGGATSPGGSAGDDSGDSSGSDAPPNPFEDKSSGSRSGRGRGRRKPSKTRSRKSK